MASIQEIPAEPPAVVPARLPFSGLALTGVAIDIMLAVYLTAFRLRHSADGQLRAEGIWPTVAFFLLVASPGLIAALAVHLRRPVLLGTAAIACLPLMALGRALLPILAVAACFAVACNDEIAKHVAHPSERRLVGAIVFLALFVIALHVWQGATGHFTYVTPTGTHTVAAIRSARAIITVVLISVSLGLSALLTSV